jgi:hypothetical protein
MAESIFGHFPIAITMTPITLSTPILRDPAVLREAVDSRMRSMIEQTAALAGFEQTLSPVERLEWVLSQCRYSILGWRFHIWVQHWCLEGRPDGPGMIAAIAEAARPLDGMVADLLRWTANRGVWARTRQRPEALTSVVPEVWSGARDRVLAFLDAVCARWPEDVDPFNMPAPAPWKRKLRRGPITVSYPTLTLEGVIESTAHALWLGGAGEDKLDAFFKDRDKLPDVLPRYVSIDEAMIETIRAALNPPEPLAVIGIERLEYPSLVIIALAHEAQVLGVMKQYNSHVMRPEPGTSLTQAAYAGARLDRDVFLGWARDLIPEDVKTLAQVAATGVALLLLGEGDLVEAIAARTIEYGAPVVRIA